MRVSPVENMPTSPHKLKTMNFKPKVEGLQSTLGVTYPPNRRRTSIRMSDMVKLQFKGGVEPVNSIIGKFGAPEQPDFKELISSVLAKAPT